MPYSHILFQVEESGIALLTVNRPEKLNALSGAVIGELGDAFGRVAGEPAIRAAILTGAGEKAFVAGGGVCGLGGRSAPAGGALALPGGGGPPRGRPDRCGGKGVRGGRGYSRAGGAFASRGARLRPARAGRVPSTGDLR